MEFIAQLAKLADMPGFPWKKIVMGITIGHFAFDAYLSYRQYLVLKKPKPPAELEGLFDDATFKKSQGYSRAKAKFSVFSSIFSLTQNLAIFHYDVLPKLFSVTSSLLTKYAPSWFTGVGPSSIVFFFGFSLLGSLIAMPLELYYQFVLEEKFGFNKQTPGLFFVDFLKGQVLSFALGTPLIVAILKIVDYFGDKFFFYLWAFMCVFQLVMMVVYPMVIAPWFNKFTPLEAGELRSSVEALANRVSFPLSKMYVIDGSQRSSHSNAYFTGLPGAKQIVLYDTLIDHCSVGEITAIVGHELGHWKLNHLPRRLLTMQLHMFVIFASFSAFIHNKSLYNSFGFYNEYPILIGLMLFTDILTPIETVMTFLSSAESRKHEFEADAYALSLGYKDDLAAGLINLQKENLGTMDSDWLYSAYHYSHPILAERLRALEYKPKK